MDEEIIVENQEQVKNNNNNELNKLQKKQKQYKKHHTVFKWIHKLIMFTILFITFLFGSVNITSYSINSQSDGSTNPLLLDQGTQGIIFFVVASFVSFVYHTKFEKRAAISKKKYRYNKKKGILLPH